MTTDWFPNRIWNESVELVFEEKVRRAKDKAQYLRIQASTLARSYPEIALRLLDRYFELPQDFDHAEAHVDRAAALLALGRVDDAIVAYEAALAREAVFPNVKTQAYLGLPFVVAKNGLRPQYQRALEVLEGHVDRLAFPVEHFLWHASRALIAADSDELSAAKAHAGRALESAAKNHSGFWKHPSLGLVTDEYAEVIDKMEAYRAA